MQISGRAWRALRTAVIVGTSAVIIGCEMKSGPSPQESLGEVAGSWTPPSVPEVDGVPTAAVRDAIRERLAAMRPEPLGADSWKHAAGLYRMTGGGAIWMDEDGIDRDRVSGLLKALSESHRDAIRLENYPLADVTRALTSIEENDRPTAAQLAEVDVVLTAVYVAFAEGLLTGQIDPRSVSQSWHIDPKEEDVDSALTHGLREKSLAESIGRMRPQDQDYKVLQDGLTKFQEIVAHGGWPTVPKGKALKPGDLDSPERLDSLSARLAAERFIPDSQSARGAATNDDSTVGVKRLAQYDSRLATAVALYQAQHGIEVDSVLGPETVTSLNLPASYRLGQIAANLERLRWMPRSLGDRYVVVNVPAFQLQAYDSGKKALEMKVIVGSEFDQRRTPVFSDSMHYVVFRPYWNVPDAIADKEIWLKAKADRGYLERNRYEVARIDGKTRIRQRPGEDNSLGLVKFLFPNDFSVYLHDTPQHQLFDKDVRAFSHGCIRVERPADLASWVLGWPVDSVTRAMEQGPDNKQITLPSKIPVFITYLTVYARDGQLWFGNDLYARDEALVAAVQDGAAPSEAAVQAIDTLRRLAKD